MSTIAQANVPSWRFETAANAYKAVYLAAMVGNWALLVFKFGMPLKFNDLSLCLLWLAWFVVFAANAIGWYGRSRRHVWAFHVEEALSRGRMVMIVLAAIPFGLDIVVMFSPIGLIFWFKLLSTAESLRLPMYPVNLSICVVLLLFEIFHYRWLSGFTAVR